VVFPPSLVRASRRMAFLSAAAVVLVPLSTVLLFVVPDFVKKVGGDISITAHYGHLLGSAVPLPDRLIALGFAMIPTAIATWGLIALVRLFNGFRSADAFSHDTLRAFCNVAAALFWNVIATMATEPAITFFLTRAQIHKSVSLYLGTDDVELLFLAGVAYVIARVMAEARAVAEENAKFV